MTAVRRWRAVRQIGRPFSLRSKIGQQTHKARIGRRAIDRIAKTAIRRDDNRALPDRHGKVQAIADRVAEFQGQVGGAEQVAVHGAPSTAFADIGALRSSEILSVTWVGVSWPCWARRQSALAASMSHRGAQSNPDQAGRERGHCHLPRPPISALLTMARQSTFLLTRQIPVL